MFGMACYLFVLFFLLLFFKVDQCEFAPADVSFAILKLHFLRSHVRFDDGCTNSGSSFDHF